jgi:transcriptional regulator with XRE-family HTH domain
MPSNNDLSKRIASKIIELRSTFGWNQKELASKADITGAALSQIEKGDRVPTLIVFRKLANALGIQVEEFLNDQTDESRSEEKQKITAFFREWEGLGNLGKEEQKIIKALIKKLRD